MPSKNLSVFLNEYFVGTLTQLPDGTTLFAFDEPYLNDTKRPILSLSYKNVLNDIRKTAQRPSFGLPPFFTNLLPEGRLRKYLAQKAGVKETQEFRLLTALRDDLPGAIILKPDAHALGQVTPAEDDRTDASSIEGALRFSLAGIQMKFSGDLKDSRIAFPASGIGGHWIVKLAAPVYPHLVELEYSMLSLASQIGIAVPEFRILPTGHIENLPQDFPEALDGDCLIVKRFDRIANGGRIHMEDFAQVYGVTDKYDPLFNYQSIGQVLWLEMGLDGILEYVRRLVHMVLTGNGDMHLKNWALIYPNPHQPTLSPAYDFVSTIVYPDINSTLALKIGRTREFKQITLDTFKQFAEIAKLPKQAVLNTVIATVDAIKDQWPKLAPNMPIPDSYKRLIEQHMKAVPFFSERPTIVRPSAAAPSAVTWTGFYFTFTVVLDETVPDGEVIYKSESGKTVELKAPRRMVAALVQKQLHRLVVDHRDFANQHVEARVGLALFDDWRKDAFIRIANRLVQGGLTEDLLKQPDITIRATFFPINWRKLETHYKNKHEKITLDFVLHNWELWTCECILLSLALVELHPDGRRTADVHLSIKSAKRLFELPAQSRSMMGSDLFYGLAETRYIKALV